MKFYKTVGISNRCKIGKTSTLILNVVPSMIHFFLFIYYTSIMNNRLISCLSAMLKLKMDPYRLFDLTIHVIEDKPVIEKTKTLLQNHFNTFFRLVVQGLNHDYVGCSQWFQTFILQYLSCHKIIKNQHVPGHLQPGLLSYQVKIHYFFPYNQRYRQFLIHGINYSLHISTKSTIL